MKKSIASCLIILLIAKIPLLSQEGYIYLNHYEIDESYADSKIKSIAFDDYSSVLLANRKGVAVFNGNSWNHVKNIPANVLVIKADPSLKRIYAGLKNEFGYIFRDSLGIYRYQTLKQLDDNASEFDQIIIASDYVFFYSTKNIFKVDMHHPNTIKQVEYKPNSEYNGILKKGNQIYINVKNSGICMLEGDKLIALKEGSKFKDKKILFSANCNKINVLVGTNENELYLFNGTKFKQFSDKTQIRDFMKENILSDGLDFSDKYFALATLTGGCVIIDKVYGKIFYSINYMTGLPDDEIYAMTLDKNNSLWIAHEHGLSNCDLNLTLRNYSQYPGILGNINDILIKDGRLYVASNNGVYILTEIKNVKEKEYFINEKAKYGYKFKPKKAYITNSIGHKFIPVINLSDKCKQLYEYQGKVLAISDFGLYELSDSMAIPLVKDIYINSLFPDRDTNVIYAASLKGFQMLSYVVDSVKKETKWEKIKLFENITDAIYSVVQTKNGDLIFGAEGKAWFSKKDSLLSYSSPVEINFPEKVNEPIKAQVVNGEVLFIQSTDIFIYNENIKSVTYKNKKKFERNNLRYINSNTNTWIFEDSLWVSVDPNLQVDNNQYWKLFGKIRKLYIDNEKNAWLINGKKELIKILADGTKKIDADFKICITEVSDKMDSLYKLNNPTIEYDRNALKFRISAPFWLDPTGTQYRFKVEGLKNYESWSNWSENPEIELSFLPVGKFTLTVNARNILGQLSNEEKLSFTVLKPFWQTDIFYYGAGGAILVFIILIFILRNMVLRRKNRKLEEKVKQRTIELQEEKDKTEKLLLNILPRETAEELKQNNKVVPRNYELVTVLFTDFKGFTMIAEKLTPEELVHEIDYCFKEFDRIISKYRVEKIKTIGDAYMCAAGLPIEDKKNATEAVMAAIDICRFMDEHKAHCIKENKPCFEIRIGLHTGKVVAGVVGIKKYAYDIWGDTVNIAARMESSGEPGKINISGDTYELVKKKFNCTHRGKVEAKNKGQIDMYFVEGVK